MSNIKLNPKKVEVKFNTPIEVSEFQYNVLRKDFQGILAFRQSESDGKFFINLFMNYYKSQVQNVLDECFKYESEYC